MKRRILFCLSAAMLASSACAQIFSNDVWEQRNVVSAKMSQLYGEVNIGVNLFPQKHSANFLYVAFGYGKPTKRNAWRKFTPDNEVPDGLPKALKEKLADSSTDDLHAGKIGVGWNHWFNHTIGCYVQTGWGFIADLSTGDDLTDEEKALLVDSGERQTYIYNTMPVEIGLTLNAWKRYNVMAGVTYMWKEIPLLTIGVGYTF